jgi:uncharacterized 2Fe-2S/4Fe-4S cluster protein (DUF4445 family)
MTAAAENVPEMKRYTITVLPQNRECQAVKGTLLIDILRNSINDDSENPLILHTPCGGKGVCGKCIIQVLHDDSIPVHDADHKFLTQQQIAAGYRLSCLLRIESDLTIVLPKNDSDRLGVGQRILSEQDPYSGKRDQITRKYFLELKPPSIQNQTDDLERIISTAAEVGCGGLAVSGALAHALIPELPGLIRDSDYKLTLAVTGDRIVSLESGDTTASNYYFSIDLGTTTVVVYLLNTVTGELIDTLSELNMQRSFGADVISRISYTLDHEDGLALLQDTIVTQLHRMMSLLATNNDMPNEYVYGCMLAGNTTMLHLYSGTNPVSIARSPYIPVFTQMLQYHGKDAEIVPEIFPNCTLYLLPGISGYIGSDITTGILAVNLWKQSELSLLVDIGTNGEIVLGSKAGITACATAAGPAFEGFHISCGTGGIAGAVEKVIYDPKIDDISCNTIQELPAVGICGSGMVDLAALLVTLKMVDGKGKFLKTVEITPPLSKRLQQRRQRVNNKEVFILDDGSGSADGNPIIFTQQDMRELQLAKAAIAAGIETLISKTDTNINEIAHVYIAGGFGNYIHKESALIVGLLPAELAHRIELVGNSAGKGAIMCAMSQSALDGSSEIRKMVKYIELSSEESFKKALMKHMYFLKKE